VLTRARFKTGLQELMGDGEVPLGPKKPGMFSRDGLLKLVGCVCVCVCVCVLSCAGVCCVVIAWGCCKAGVERGLCDGPGALCA
jgi:hypothetical protein